MMLKKLCQITAIIFFVLINAQSKDAPSIKEIMKTLKNKEYSSKVIRSLRNTMSFDNSEYVVVEQIPNDIIFYSVKPKDGNTYSTIPYLYKITGDQVTQIDLTPSDKEGKIESSFYDKVKLQTKADWKFLGYVDYQFRKDRKGVYIIKTTIKSAENDVYTIFEFDYSTKDFLTFIPLKLSRDGVRWSNIK